ncbi:hypothetical protein E2C01_090509 [Portunus trituberculatus]|uniref:Uncharacterized protein n=1 Tax=Portunus trituberculatus TaxID=210409 RepID=A0A5B7JL21_PORTR|nr:hypothetical protein [Portunus trituberculatus]
MSDDVTRDMTYLYPPRLSLTLAIPQPPSSSSIRNPRPSTIPNFCNTTQPSTTSQRLPAATLTSTILPHHHSASTTPQPLH